MEERRILPYAPRAAPTAPARTFAPRHNRFTPFGDSVKDMAAEESSAPVEVQLEEVSEAIQRAAADLLAARLVLDRERAEFTAKGAQPSRALLIAATRVVDEMRRTDEALTSLLKELELRTASQ